MTLQSQEITTNGATQPSEWQKRIEGVWYGRPAVFEPDGTLIGYNNVFRSSVFKDGKTTYFMDTQLQGTGALRYRFDAREFAFGLNDTGRDRIYLGPDFIGAGHPTGMLVDAHYYSPQWSADLRTMVHLPDKETEVYSSLLYDGPTLCGVFNGIYKVAFDYETNEDTKARIDSFIETEIANGGKPHVLPAKTAGVWTGEMEVFGADQQRLGVNRVTLRYQPTALLRAKVTLTIEGVVNKQVTFERFRSNNRHTFDGPDVFGNAIAYGRALYTSKHFYGEALKIKGRDFLIDDQFTISAVWQFFASDQKLYTTYGILRWKADEV
jgi:hypothetical protein